MARNFVNIPQWPVGMQCLERLRLWPELRGCVVYFDSITLLSFLVPSWISRAAFPKIQHLRRCVSVFFFIISFQMNALTKLPEIWQPRVLLTRWPTMHCCSLVYEHKIGFGQRRLWSQTNNCHYVIYEMDELNKPAPHWGTVGDYV